MTQKIFIVGQYDFEFFKNCVKYTSPYKVYPYEMMEVYHCENLKAKIAENFEDCFFVCWFPNEKQAIEYCKQIVDMYKSYLKDKEEE